MPEDADVETEKLHEAIHEEPGAMTTRRTFVISSRLTACGAVLLTLTLVAMACDGFGPAGQAIFWERRASNPTYGAGRCRRPCGATALPGDVRSGILSRTNRPTPDRAA